jgi:hypothetical protein
MEASRDIRARAAARWAELRRETDHARLIFNFERDRYIAVPSE